MTKPSLTEQLTTLIDGEQEQLEKLREYHASVKMRQKQAVKVELLRASQYFLVKAQTKEE